MTDLPEHVSRNRVRWDDAAEQYVAAGERGWARETPAWGIWGVPESDVRMLPDDLAGKDAIELGCGTAYISAWLARRGARVVGIDNSEAQLATARRLQQQHALDFPLLHGNAEAVPFPDGSFDFAISEYGASLWADPARWVPEDARLLRPGGRLVLLTNSFLLTLCMPAEDGAAATGRLLRPAFGMYRMQWPGDPGVEFHLSHGDWIRLLRRSGFEVQDLIEVRLPHEPGHDFAAGGWVSLSSVLSPFPTIDETATNERTGRKHGLLRHDPSRKGGTNGDARGADPRSTAGDLGQVFSRLEEVERAGAGLARARRHRASRRCPPTAEVTSLGV